MPDLAVVAKVAVESVLLEARQGGVRLKVRGAPAVHLPWEAALAVAREMEGLAEAALRARA